MSKNKEKSQCEVCHKKIDLLLCPSFNVDDMGFVICPWCIELNYLEVIYSS